MQLYFIYHIPILLSQEEMPGGKIWWLRWRYKKPPASNLSHSPSKLLKPFGILTPSSHCPLHPPTPLPPVKWLLTIMHLKNYNSIISTTLYFWLWYYFQDVLNFLTHWQTRKHQETTETSNIKFGRDLSHHLLWFSHFTLIPLETWFRRVLTRTRLFTHPRKKNLLREAVLFNWTSRSPRQGICDRHRRGAGSPSQSALLPHLIDQKTGKRF